MRELIRKDWGLLLVLVVACGLRMFFFTGFSQEADLNYYDYTRLFLSGIYPSLDLGSPFAFQPLLFSLMAASLKVLGENDFGLVGAYFVFSLIGIVICYYLAKLFIPRGAALLAATLLAVYPFHVIGSSIVNNELILGVFIHAAFLCYFLSEQSRRQFVRNKSYLLALIAALLLFCGWLVNNSIFPALVIVGIWSLFFMFKERRFLGPHLLLFSTFFALLLCTSLIYFFYTGEFIRQFRSEYFSHVDQLAANPEVLRQLVSRDLSFYFDHLFLLQGPPGFSFLEHGLHYYILVIVLLDLALTRKLNLINYPLSWIGFYLLFLHLFPQKISPYYIPIDKQVAYLENISISVAIVIGYGLYQLRFSKVMLSLTLAGIFGFSLLHISDRYFELNDSFRDAELIVEYLGESKLDREQALHVDRPLGDAIKFYLGDQRDQWTINYVNEDTIKDVKQGYVLVGGGRPSWWDLSSTPDLQEQEIPLHWVEIHRVNSRETPWRSSKLRVYKITGGTRSTRMIALSPVSSQARNQS